MRLPWQCPALVLPGDPDHVVHGVYPGRRPKAIVAVCVKDPVAGLSEPLIPLHLLLQPVLLPLPCVVPLCQYPPAHAYRHPEHHGSYQQAVPNHFHHHLCLSPPRHRLSSLFFVAGAAVRPRASKDQRRATVRPTRRNAIPAPSSSLFDTVRRVHSWFDKNCQRTSHHRVDIPCSIDNHPNASREVSYRELVRIDARDHEHKCASIEPHSGIAHIRI